MAHFNADFSVNFPILPAFTSREYSQRVHFAGGGGGGIVRHVCSARFPDLLDFQPKFFTEFAIFSENAGIIASTMFKTCENK